MWFFALQPRESQQPKHPQSGPGSCEFAKFGVVRAQILRLAGLECFRPGTAQAAPLAGLLCRRLRAGRAVGGCGEEGGQEGGGRGGVDRGACGLAGFGRALVSFYQMHAVWLGDCQQPNDEQNNKKKRHPQPTRKNRFVRVRV